MIGLYGRKRGMAAIFADGKHTAVTIIEVGPCPIVQVKSEDRDKYSALQMAFEPVQEKSVNKPRAGHFARAGVAPHRVLGEFRNFEGDYKTGDVLNVGLFKAGDVVDVTGVSKGRGFAGVIKRYRFQRPNQSHGTHEIFRGTGSVGAGTFPGRVWPGKRMPGRMGGERVTVKHLTVLQIDAEKGMMIVKGAVPGAPGGVVRIRKSNAH